MTKSLEATSSWLAGDVDKYNKELPLLIRKEFEARKSEVLKSRQIAASIGVPLSAKPNIPTTFAVPTLARKRITPKPTPSLGSFAPEPTIDASIYQDILAVIQDSGRVWERLPSLYDGKDEEALRDHLILLLEPRFQGSTTGETFNKSGKTDILMRYE